MLLHVKRDTLRVGDLGYVVLTSRRSIQRAVSEFAAFYRQLLARHAARGLYPARRLSLEVADRAGQVRRVVAR